MKHLGINIIDKKTLENLSEQQIKLEQLKHVEQILSNSVNDYIGKISFSLMDDGSVDISCEWMNDIPQLTKVFALMLETINTGQYSDDLEKALLSNDDDDFAQECLEYWNSIKNEPIIKPHEVFESE